MQYLLKDLTGRDYSGTFEKEPLLSIMQPVIEEQEELLQNDAALTAEAIDYFPEWINNAEVWEEWKNETHFIIRIK